MSTQEPEADQPPSLLKSLADRLDSGEVIAFPTETFYGLLARIDRPAALHRVFELKGRAAGEPLPVIAADQARATALWNDVPEAARTLMAAFWPGPLTIVLGTTAEKVNPLVTGGGYSVGVRVPGSAAARGVAAMAGGYLAATSANPSGRPPAMDPETVRAYFGDAVAIAEGPRLAPSRGSTVISLMSWPPQIRREGDISREALARALAAEIH